MSNFSQFTGGGGIKSIQRGVMTFPSTAAGTATATITAVNTAKSELRLLGVSSNGGTAADQVLRISLTNSTTITATKEGASSQPSLSWELTEWN